MTNSLELKPPFEKVLIANRGEIARRVLRTCKRLGVHTVAVYSDADRDALHVAEADEAVRIGAAPPKDSYLNADAILSALRATGAQAVHPGYGFLSERSFFARGVQAAGATFIGPPPEVLEAFGDKMKARAVALAAGVAPVPGSDEPMALGTDEQVARAKEIARIVGYPVMVKPVGGGGGIGMQVVTGEQELERALKACSDRGRAGFAVPRVYV
jgi:acetyl-CoA carboxylase biotin carboxylase subunit/3-methylcrotonyl-CoA carboxylase alpha subunit